MLLPRADTLGYVMSPVRAGEFDAIKLPLLYGDFCIE
tara:strand:+ start:120 stop:230 length:111 start_codon:yes stop_codon:yes gene_type:complete